MLTAEQIETTRHLAAENASLRAELDEARLTGYRHLTGGVS